MRFGGGNGGEGGDFCTAENKKIKRKRSKQENQTKGNKTQENEIKIAPFPQGSALGVRSEEGLGVGGVDLVFDGVRRMEQRQRMGGGGYWGSPPIGTTLEDSLAGSGLWLLEMKLFVFISVVVVFGFFLVVFGFFFWSFFFLLPGRIEER